MPNTWEFNNVILEPPDQRARMLAEEATNFRFHKISYTLGKLANLYRFLDAHRNVSPVTLAGLVTEHGKNVRCQIVKPDGSTVEFEGKHTFSDEQVEWFKAGSALNVVRRKVAEGKS